MAFTDQPGSNFQIDLKDSRNMAITPKPVQKPFRRFEIAAGLLCIAAGIWLLAEFGLWLAGNAPHVHISYTGEAILTFVQSVYLIGFSVNLLRSGRIALVFWMLAVAILVTLPLTTGMFS